MLPAHFQPSALLHLQEQATRRWHQPASDEPAQPSNLQSQPSELEALTLAQHRANFDLWHCEDNARDPEATDSQIASIKRAIDPLNQQRNDLVESIDLLLVEAAGQQDREAPLHSETPGLMIDRLSILALKLYHTEQETLRPEAPPEHRERNRVRLQVLSEQRHDLAHCLGALWTDVLAGRRRFKLYRQMKMYNDPALNPVLYKRREPL